jgi:hypothetical protein
LSGPGALLFFSLDSLFDLSFWWSFAINSHLLYSHDIPVKK